MISKKILIIEDEEFLSEMYKMKFMQEGYRVFVADNGLEGIELAKKEKPDLILLDLVLPNMDGYKVLKELKGKEETKNIKIYILSNLGQNGEINKGFTGGADGYLVKANLTPSQLAENVGRIFNGQTVGVKKRVDTLVVKKKPVAELTEGPVNPVRNSSGALNPAGIILKSNPRFTPLDSFASKRGKEQRGIISNGVKSRGISILLIEDEDAIIEMYKMRLKKEGYEVEIAKNGAWGIKRAKERKFDIIIMDMMMPAMNGYRAIEELKSGEETKDVPIIVLSNSAQDKEIERAKECGAACYLLKSQITPARLVKEIEKVLKNS